MKTNISLSFLIMLFFCSFTFGQFNAIHIQLSKIGEGIAPAKFIVEDEQGRKTGTDPVTGTAFREIPRAHYGDEGLDDHETGGPGDLWRIFLWDPAERGSYRIKVIGISVDSFTLNIQMGRVHAKTAIFRFSGTTSPGQLTEYRMYYDPDTSKRLYAEHILPVPSQHPTIQAAVNAAQRGDVIEVSPGSYPELVLISNKDSIILRTTGQVTVRGFKLQQSHRIPIKGFVIDATGTGKSGIEMMGGNNQNSDVTIEACEIKNSGNDHHGISIARGNPRTRIVNNRIHSNGRNGIMIIDATGGPHYVVNNTIVRNGWNGIHVARQHVIYLVNNILSFNGTKSGSTGGRYGVQREGMTGPGEASGITLLNNLLAGNNGTISSTSSKDIGNYVQTLDATDSGNWTTAGNEGSGVTAAPMLTLTDVLVSTTDFHLASGSFAINRGLNTYTPPDVQAGAIPGMDFEGQQRPQGTAVDLGADEKE